MGKETAEQKLLKLIEATNAQAAPASGAAPAAVSSSAVVNDEATKIFQSVSNVGVAGMNVPPGLDQIFALLRGFLGVPGQGFGLKEFNRIFMVGVLLFVVFFSIDLMRSMNKSKHEIKLVMVQTRSSKGGAQGVVWMPMVKSFPEYAEVMAKRNIFQPFELKIEQKVEETPEAKSGIQMVADQVKDLRLVGISWLDSPDSASAMIENTANGSTYFLGVGDKIQNVTVQQIYADSIVIKYQNEEMELRL